MSTRHELIIGENIIATTYADPDRNGQDIFVYDLPQWDDIPESIRNTSENRAGQGTKISKRKRQNGKEFQAVLGARKDTLAMFELRAELERLNELSLPFDITLIRYIDIGEVYPMIRTETFEDCVIKGGIPWTWQGELGEESDVEVTISFISENPKPVVTTEPGDPDTQLINQTVVQDANASHAAISAYITGVTELPTEEELEALLVLTGENTGNVVINGMAVTITIQSPITGYTQTRNATISIDWSDVNEVVDADVAATIAAIEAYLPESITEPITVEELTPYIVQSDDNNIGIRIEDNLIYVDGSNPRSGYSTTSSTAVPPFDDSEIITTIQDDNAFVYMEIVRFVNYNRTPTLAQLNALKRETGNNVQTITLNGDIITVQTANPATTYVATNSLAISEQEDYAALEQTVRDDIAATAENIESYLNTLWEGQELTVSFLNQFIVKTGYNYLTIEIFADYVRVNGMSPVNGYEAPSQDVQIPNQQGNTLEEDVLYTYNAIQAYINENTEYTLADLEVLKVQSPGHTITLSEDTDYVFIQGTDGVTTVSRTAVKNNAETELKRQKIDDSYNYTIEDIQNYVADNPNGPFDEPTLRTFIYNPYPNEVTVELNVVNNEMMLNVYILGFPYSKSGSLFLPEPVITDPFAQNAVFWLPLQEDFDDKTGNGMDGVVNGNIVLEDASGINGINSANFDGMSYIQLPTMNPDFTQGFSYSIMLKIDNLIQYGSITDFAQGPDSYNILFSSYSGYRMTQLIFNPFPPTLFDSGYVPTQSEWNMFTVTIDANGNSYFYVNGVGYSGKYMPLPATIERQLNFIGAQSYNYQNAHEGGVYEGNIAHVRMWNRALTEIEVGELYTYLTTVETDTLQEDIDVTAENIRTHWANNPTWDPFTVQNWGAFIQQSPGNIIDVFVQSSNSVQVVGNNQDGDYQNVFVLNPDLNEADIRQSVDNAYDMAYADVENYIADHPGDVITNAALASIPYSPVYNNERNVRRQGINSIRVEIANWDINYYRNGSIENIVPEQWVNDAKLELQTAVQATQASLETWIANNPGWTMDDIYQNDTSIIVPPASSTYQNRVWIEIENWDDETEPPVAYGSSPNIGYNYYWSNADNTYNETGLNGGGMG